ncbi:MAG: hypothetical protein GC193_01595 [Cryomorphaceae bacterium]|nr:hypothetical protein [Cryomorphaceae bacterium]
MSTKTHLIRISFLALAMTTSMIGTSQEQTWWEKMFRKEKVEEMKGGTEEEPVKVQVPQDTMKEKPVVSVPQPIVTNGEGLIIVHTPAKLNRLDSLHRADPPKLDGYRVQIYFGDLSEARGRRSAFLSSHKDMPCYMVQNPPNFAVQVGDFRDQLEAYRHLQQLKSSYPGAIVVSSEIEMPRISSGH